jgi:hypothetical protein
MRVLVDYGLTRPALSPAHRPDLPGAAGGAGTGNGVDQSGTRTVTRQEAVLVVDFNPRAEAGADGRRGVAPGSPEAAAAGATANPGSDEGIPIPGTPYALVTSDRAARRDAQVRQHERSHLLALGPYAASNISYSTATGPDGRSYAVGGSIKADLSEVPGDPRATLRKANAVRRAALAANAPSSADLRVAARAYRLAREAQEQIEAERLGGGERSGAGTAGRVDLIG